MPNLSWRLPHLASRWLINVGTVDDVNWSITWAPLGSLWFRVWFLRLCVYLSCLLFFVFHHSMTTTEFLQFFLRGVEYLNRLTQKLFCWNSTSKGGPSEASRLTAPGIWGLLTNVLRWLTGPDITRGGAVMRLSRECLGVTGQGNIHGLFSNCFKGKRMIFEWGDRDLIWFVIYII